MSKEQRDRVAEILAQEIVAANTTAPHLATQSARHMHKVDTIANIIKSRLEMFGAETGSL